MTDEQFERQMRDAAQSFNTPPEILPFDEMWAEIDRQWNAEQKGDRVVLPATVNGRAPRRSIRSLARIAAVLLVGVALGRISASFHLKSAAGTSPATSVAAAQPEPFVSEQDRFTTNAYLGQAAALMISLPSELRSTRRDSAFVSRAANLLLQTRLLLDSPSASDPALHSLFQDLEVVLAQVVRLKSDSDPAQLDLVTNALEQRDVLPRLRLAVADHIAN